MIKNILFIVSLLFSLLSCKQNISQHSTANIIMRAASDTVFNHLSDKQLEVMCGGGTEKPFTGKYLYNKEKGIYTCAACNNPLFSSKTKFESGSGWPSFFEQINSDAIIKKPDFSHDTERTEIICANCKGHLGHVFDDGPEPTGLRYCVNSVSLLFVPEK